MKKLMLFVSCVAFAVAMTGCKDNAEKEARQMMNEQFRQERKFDREAVRHRSPDVQKVDVIGNSVVYTHIFDGIIDVKTYTYDGDVCVEAERVYFFPDQMSALRHYRRAVEQAQLYDNIELFNNEVRYDLKDEQHALETKGLTKEQLKARFDKQISDAKAEMHRENAKMKQDFDKMKMDARKDCKKDCKKDCQDMNHTK